MSESEQVIAEVARTALRKTGGWTAAAVGTVVAGPVGGVVALALYYVGLFSLASTEEEVAKLNE